jgi:futalosine hydrolase
MNILLVVATKEEVEPVMATLATKEGELVIDSHHVHVLVTGVGMVATTYHLTSMFSSDINYDLILNIGLAGSFTRELELGTVVQVTLDKFVELGAEDDKEFVSAIELGLVQEEEVVVRNDHTFKNEVVDGLVQVEGITVNTVHGNESSIARVMKRTSADVETMEGAAFFYVCRKERQACAQIRAISNYVEKRDKSSWELDLSLNNLSTVVIDILKAL